MTDVLTKAEVEKRLAIFDTHEWSDELIDERVHRPETFSVRVALGTALDALTRLEAAEEALRVVEIHLRNIHTRMYHYNVSEYLPRRDRDDVEAMALVALRALPSFAALSTDTKGEK